MTEESGRNMAVLAAPILRELTAMTGESALVTHRVGERVLCVGFQEGPRTVHVGLGPAADTPCIWARPPRCIWRTCPNTTSAASSISARH